MNDSNDAASGWLVSSLPDDKSKTDSSIAATTTSGNSNSPKTTTRLFLHFDINETILLGDPAGGDSRHDSVQKMLAKSAFCQVPSSNLQTMGDDKNDWKLLENSEQMEPTHWWDGQPIGQETTIPPLYTGWKWPHHCVPYYRTKFKKKSKTFCDGDGKVYQPVLEACEDALQRGHILPAFYRTLDHLIQNEHHQPFKVIFRTFGDDIDEIATLVTEFAQGKHPDFPNIQYPNLELPVTNLYQGRWRQDGDDISTRVYQLWDREETKVVASGDAEILKFLEDHSGCCGIRDDYNFWKANLWDCTAGKPVWIPNTNSKRHLLFDDNIHNVPHDGIACVRKQNKNGSFVTLDGATMHEHSQGVHMVRVPTVEPVLNPKWYIEQIRMAQARHAKTTD